MLVNIHTIRDFQNIPDNEESVTLALHNFNIPCSIWSTHIKSCQRLIILLVGQTDIGDVSSLFTIANLHTLTIQPNLPRSTAHCTLSNSFYLNNRPMHFTLRRELTVPELNILHKICTMNQFFTIDLVIGNNNHTSITKLLPFTDTIFCTASSVPDLKGYQIKKFIMEGSYVPVSMYPDTLLGLIVKLNSLTIQQFKSIVDYSCNRIKYITFMITEPISDFSIYDLVDLFNSNVCKVLYLYIVADLDEQEQLELASMMGTSKIPSIFMPNIITTPAAQTKLLSLLEINPFITNLEMELDIDRATHICQRNQRNQNKLCSLSHLTRKCLNQYSLPIPSYLNQ